MPNERDNSGRENSNPEDVGPSDQITPDRLIEVASAVYEACNEWSHNHNGKSIYPTELLGSMEQPKSMTEFTRFEVEEAAMFLVRMGFIQPPRATNRP